MGKICCCRDDRFRPRKTGNAAGKIVCTAKVTAEDGNHISAGLVYNDDSGVTRFTLDIRCDRPHTDADCSDVNKCICTVEGIPYPLGE